MSKLLLLSVLLCFNSAFQANGNTSAQHRVNRVCDSGNNLNETLRKELNCDSNYSWNMVSVEKDQSENFHFRYQQCYYAIPVENAVVIVTKTGEKQIQLTGTFIPVNALLPSRLLSQYDAYSAFKTVSSAKKDVQLSDTEINESMQIKWVTDSSDGHYFLAYQLEVQNDPDPVHQVYILDAQNGCLISMKNHICFADVTGSAQTAYYGTRQIPTSFNQNQFSLKTGSRGNGIETYNLNNNLNYTTISDFTDSDNFWLQSVPAVERHATDAHYGAVQYYDFLNVVFNRNSIDNSGQKLVSYLNYGNNLVNAFWNGTAVVYGGGNQTNSPMTTLDITGHEFTHGLIQKTANLNYSGEPGTVNEAVADMFGTALEFSADPQHAGWTIGEKSGNIIRSMSDPKLFNQPDTYLGVNWYTGTGDNGGVHINSGFINKWFYLISEGGQGVNDNGTSYQVTGIGIQDAIKIVYQSLIARMVPTSGFDDFKNATLRSAADLYGSCSPQYIAVAESWMAVGLGQGINQPLLLTASGNTVFCAGESVILNATGMAGSEYSWMKNGTIVSSNSSMQMNVDQSGIWTVSENRCGTVLNSAPVEIIVHDLPIVSTSDMSACKGEQVFLSGFPSGGSYNVANPYSGNSTSFNYTFTDANGCSSVGTGNIVVHENPIVEITPINNIIPANNQPVILSANVQGTFTGPGVDNNIFYPSMAGIGGPYPVSIYFTNSFGCASSDTIYLTVIQPCLIPSETLKINQDKNEISMGDTVNFSINAEAADYQLNWKIPDNCRALTSLDQSAIQVIWNSTTAKISVELLNTCNDKFGIESEMNITELEKSIVLEVFPVPAHDHIKIKYDGLDLNPAVSIRITDMNGKLVMNHPSVSSEGIINIDHLNPGSYFIEVMDGSKIIRKRMVKY